MSTEIETVQQLYDFLAVGNIQGIIDVNSENTIWDFVGDPERVAYSGTWAGPEGIADWAQTIGGVLQVNEFTPLEFLQNGDRVAVRIRERGQSPFTNVPYQDDLTQLWTVNSEGEITFLESIYNTYIFNQVFANVEPDPILPNDIVGEAVVIDTTADPNVSLGIVEDFWTALAAGEEFGSFLAEDVIWSYGSSGDRDLLDFTGVFESPQGVEDWLFEFEEDLELGEISIAETFAEGNRVMLRLFQDDATVESTGNQFDQNITSWVTVTDGKISTVENIVDNNIIIEAAFPGDNYPLPPTVTEPFVVVSNFESFGRTEGSPNEQLFTYDDNGNFLSFFDGLPEDYVFSANAPLVGPNSSVYVSNQLGNRIERFDLAGNWLGTFGEATNEGSGLVYPTTTALGPDGNFYVNSGGTSQVLQFDGNTGEFLRIFAQRDNGFPDNVLDPLPPPDFTDLDFGPDGDLYVTSTLEDGDDNPENGIGTIRRYGGPNSGEPGALKRVYTLNKRISDAEFGSDGRLYVTDILEDPGVIYAFSPESEQSDNNLLEVFVSNTSSNFLATYDGELPVDGIVGLKFNRHDGNLYVSMTGVDPSVSTGLTDPSVSQIQIYAGPNSQTPGQFLGLLGETVVQQDSTPFTIGRFSGLSFSNNASIMTLEIESRFYDLDFYAQANPDLAEAGIDTPEELLNHLQTIGVEEGRRFSPYVDLEFYAQSNPDLAETGIDTPEELLEHLQTTGLAEGRRFAPTVDLDFYRSANPDLDFGDDLEAYYDHLINTGVEEGRDFIKDLVWDLDSFLALNPEISEQVGGSRKEALEYLLLFSDENTVVGNIGFPVTAAAPFYSLNADSSQIQKVSQFYQFISQTDPQGIEDTQALFTRDFLLDFTGDSERLPLAGTFEGIGGFRQWKKVQQSLQIGSFATLDFLEDGNKVAVRAAEAGQPRASNIPNTFSPTHIFTFNEEGLITEYRSYYNSYIYNEVYAGYSQTPPDELLFRQPVEVDETARPEASLTVAENFWNAWINGEDFTDFLAEDVEWTFHVSPSQDILPYVGGYEGIEGVEESLGNYNEIIAPGERSIVETFVEGNRVLIHLREENASIRSNGNEFDLDIYSWISVEDGKLSSVENVVDNHIVVDALFPGESYPLGAIPRTTSPVAMSATQVPTRDAVIAYDAEGNFTGLFGDANNFDSNLLGVLLTRGADGNIYVGDANNRVLVYNGVTGDFQGVFGETASSGIELPTDVTFGPDGNLYVSSGWSSQVLRFNGSNGEFMGVFAERDNGFSDNVIPPEQRAIIRLPDFSTIEFGPDGNMYVISFLDEIEEGVTGSIRVYGGPWSENPGEFLGRYGEGDTAINLRGNATFGDDGNLYVTDGTQNQVLIYAGPEADNPGELLGMFADYGSDFDERNDFPVFEGNLGEFREDGNFYVTIYGFNQERTAILETVTYIYAGLDQENPGEFLGNWVQNSEVTPLDQYLPREVVPQFGVTSTPAEPYIIATNLAAAEIAKFDKQGTYLGTLGEASSRDSDLNIPNLLTLGPDDHIYVNSVGSNEVLKYDAISGEFKGVFGDANLEDSGLLYPTGINFGPNGNLFVVSGATSQVLEYDGETGEFLGVFAERDNGFPNNTLPSFPPPDLTDIKFGSDGNAYVVSFNEDPDGDPSNGKGAVLVYAGPNSDNPGEPLGVFGEMENFPGFGPGLFIFGPDGNIYVNDVFEPEQNIYVYSGLESENPGELLGIFNDAFDDLQSVYGAEITRARIAGISFNEDDGNLWVNTVGYDPSIGGSFTTTEEQNISAMLIYAGPDKDNAGEFLGNFGEVQVLGQGVGTNTGGLLATGFFVGEAFEENNGIEDVPEPRVLVLRPQDPQADDITYLQINVTANDSDPSDSTGFYEGAISSLVTSGTFPLSAFGFSPVQSDDWDLTIFNSTSADTPDSFVISKETSEIPNFPFPEIPVVEIVTTFADDKQFDSTDINEFIDAVSGITGIGFSVDGEETFVNVTEIALNAFPEVEPPFEPFNLVFGTPGNDVLEAGLDFAVSNSLVFAGGGEDILDLALSEGGNRAYGGSDDDNFILETGDRAFGGDAADYFTAMGDDNRIYGGKGVDTLEVIDGGENNRLFGGAEGDTIDLSLGGGGNRAYGGDDDDTFILGTGDRVVGGEGLDRFLVGTGGDNLITGGRGGDEFWIATGEIPDAANSITDFDIAEDVIGVGGLGITSTDELTFTQMDSNTMIAFGDSDLATIFDTQANELRTLATFAFG